MYIRKATPADSQTIYGFVKDLAEYERAGHQVLLTTDDYSRYLKEGGHFNALIAEIDQRPVGMALWYKRFSTWVGDYVYLEDLYISPDSRGQGVGLKLLQKLAADAIEMGVQRMEWQVLEWNEPAVKFYTSAGANILTDWQLCQMDRASLLKFVEQAN